MSNLTPEQQQEEQDRKSQVAWDACKMPFAPAKPSVDFLIGYRYCQTERDQLRAERDEAIRKQVIDQDQCDRMTTTAGELAVEINKLRAERDAALAAQAQQQADAGKGVEERNNDWMDDDENDIQEVMDNHRDL